MSNSVDFFQTEDAGVATAGGRMSVSLEGVVSPFLEVKEIIRGRFGEFSLARLVYNPAGHPGSEVVSVEEIESLLGPGGAVRIEWIYNGGAPDVSACRLPVFRGQVEAIETELGQAGERVEIVARDFSANLEKVTVCGRRVRRADGSSVFLAGAETVFNDNSAANASEEKLEHNGFSYRVFADRPGRSKAWSYAEVIDYLLSEYIAAGLLVRPSVEQLAGLTDGFRVSDLDVTGLSLTAALVRCCGRIGLEFKFVARSAETGPGEAIVFYKPGRGRAVEVNCQKAGAKLSISKTDVSGFQSRRDFRPVTNRYIGQGDFKVYEATFDLVKAWDAADEDSDYEKFSASSNPDFYKVKDVYRKWCLNEAGDYTGEPYNRGEAFDFSKVFEGGNFAHRPRRFRPCLSRGRDGKSLGYFLQVSFDNGLHWRQYLYAFNNLLDECGVWLSSDELDVETWIAAQKGVLKFRITASVVSDERLSCVVADGPVGSTAPVVDRLITLPRQFKWRKVSGRSIFANASDDSLGVADEVDDSPRLYEYVRKRAEAGSELIETVDVRTPFIVCDYQVGDRVTSSPESRDLFGLRNDGRSVRWIERVRMDFQKQCTDLRIVRARV